MLIPTSGMFGLPAAKIPDKRRTAEPVPILDIAVVPSAPRLNLATLPATLPTTVVWTISTLVPDVPSVSQWHLLTTVPTGMSSLEMLFM